MIDYTKGLLAHRTPTAQNSWRKRLNWEYPSGTKDKTMTSIVIIARETFI